MLKTFYKLCQDFPDEFGNFLTLYVFLQRWIRYNLFKFGIKN